MTRDELLKAAMSAAEDLDGRMRALDKLGRRASATDIVWCRQALLAAAVPAPWYGPAQYGCSDAAPVGRPRSDLLDEPVPACVEGWPVTAGRTA